MRLKRLTASAVEVETGDAKVVDGLDFVVFVLPDRMSLISGCLVEEEATFLGLGVDVDGKAVICGMKAPWLVFGLRTSRPRMELKRSSASVSIDSLVRGRSVFASSVALARKVDNGIVTRIVSSIRF